MIRRHLSTAVAESLQRFPAVLLVGPRQVGKSTLAQQMLADTEGSCVTLDEPAALAAALADPDGFLSAQPRGLVVLDEVQRAPELLRACKRVIDRKREPGRFLLTGSADIRTLASVAETMAGRVIVHRLFPFSFSECREREHSRALDVLFGVGSAAEVCKSLGPRGVVGLAELQAGAIVGGMPVPALLADRQAREQWWASYLQTYVERDLLEATSAHNLPSFRRLLTALALRTGGLLNQAELSRDLAIPGTTMRRFLAVLEQVFLVHQLSPFLPNREKRMVKSPKAYTEDSGLASHLAGIGSAAQATQRNFGGRLFETWVCGELRKLIGLAATRTALMFWQTHGKHEVDFVLERGEQVVAIEVKARATIRPEDLAGLRALSDLLGPRLRQGILLHGGEEATVIGPRLCALPASALF